MKWSISGPKDLPSFLSVDSKSRQIAQGHRGNVVQLFGYISIDACNPRRKQLRMPGLYQHPISRSKRMQHATWPGIKGLALQNMTHGWIYHPIRLNNLWLRSGGGTLAIAFPAPSSSSKHRDSWLRAIDFWYFVGDSAAATNWFFGRLSKFGVSCTKMKPASNLGHCVACLRFFLFAWNIDLGLKLPSFSLFLFSRIELD